MICKKRLFLFDIDGVIRLTDKIIDGSFELYNLINKLGGKSIFLTNNSTKSISSYVETFINYGFKNIDESNFITALTVTKIFLKKKYENELIYAWGTKSFIQELLEYGLNITTKKEDYKKIKCVVVGYNNELTYQSICDLCEVLEKSDVDYYATNMDMICPTPYGYIPDCGSICKLIEISTNKTPKFLGKPETNIIELALQENDKYKKEECVIIGDRLYTDIACGINANIDTCAVLTGEIKQKDLTNTQYKPTYCYESVKEIYLDLFNNNADNEITI